MQLELHQGSARRHHDIGRDTAPHGVLILPGLDDSGPRHWQSAWSRLPHFRRVDFAEWERPRLHDWVPRLDRAVREHPRPLVLVAHSLGCIAAAWWAALSWSEAFREKVCGALLVAPPDIDDEDIEIRLRDFRPLPRLRLPFPSIVVASRNDPFCRFARAQEIASAWGSDFVDGGAIGHINSDSPIGPWAQGLPLLARLSGHNGNLLVAELGLRTAFA
ncbi:RBBP9/YdeN family alpha/beta hydrolase [Sphingomonas parva]|uniref:RBBP9/YdeN family alpha/beta hydrolase n=1 Tax=Sphingomonas parva TaxID=2555898 RepID=UPI001CDBC269|nr:alpha/beta hydrolase [Sphingomonas parva]